QKKQNHHIVELDAYRALQCKQAAYTSKVGNGRHIHVRAWPRPSRSAWAKILQTHGFPVQTWGNFKGP
ncbi:MAG: hypothetical protein MJE68_27900, partial [Proteobacteria bacterium]|nr:hypothetical protein [Pseudomonadota bacterium]